MHKLIFYISVLFCIYIHFYMKVYFFKTRNKFLVSNIRHHVVTLQFSVTTMKYKLFLIPEDSI